MGNKQKLELTWIGKDNEAKLEPRILIEIPEKSYGEEDTENMLIHGDNLLALKALEQKYTGKIKCIYIDPPYNTGSAFEYYDDGLEHSIWLTMMSERLKLLKKLLSDNGCIFVHIDDNEHAYLKVLMDEIFGRSNYINSIAIQSSTPSGLKTAHRDKTIVKTKDYILVYKKKDLIINPQYTKVYKWDTHFNLFFKRDENIVVPLKDVVYERKIYDEKVSSNKFSLEDKKFYDFVISNSDNIFQTGKSMPEEVRITSLMPENKDVPIKYNDSNEGNVQYAYNGRRMSFLRQSIHKVSIINEETISKLVCDFWSDIDFNNSQNEGGVSFPASKKPEILVYRILDMVTNEKDIVLDSFLGSGTTAAVAHKMNRKWIGIELGDHCYTHSKTRIDKVISGEQSGISKLLSWQGGGGYKFYELAPSLLKKDKHGQWIIEEKYNPEMLAEAMCKHEVFKYEPDLEYYWRQGKSTENDYIFTTTNFVTVEYLDRIHSEMKEDESLLICCKAFQSECQDRYSNISIKKIPQNVLNRCEFGKEDYSLNINEVMEVEEDEQDI